MEGHWLKTAHPITAHHGWKQGHWYERGKKQSAVTSFTDTELLLFLHRSSVTGNVTGKKGPLLPGFDASSFVIFKNASEMSHCVKIIQDPQTHATCKLFNKQTGFELDSDGLAYGGTN